MTDLVKQLEDKKKEVKDKELLLGSLFVSNGEYISLKDKTKGQMLDLIFSNNCIDNRTAILDWIELKECQVEIAILEQAIAEKKKQRQEISKSLRERIMRNGNLSNRIIENNYGEFEHKHDYILNEIVCEIIEETLQQLKQSKTEDGK